MSPDVSSLESRIGYTFRNRTLLLEAITHPSYLQDHPEVTENNQRLEFLGDAVLQLVLTHALFKVYPEDREGMLSKNRSILSKGSALSQLAREIGLDACLLLGASEESTGGRARASSLEDAFEALLGAIYLDSSLQTVSDVTLALYGPLQARLTATSAADNPKGRLQELVQPKHGNHALRYDVILTSGEDHARVYEIAVFLNDRPLGTGRGSSKKLAEEAAAQAALLILQTEPVS